MQFNSVLGGSEWSLEDTRRQDNQSFVNMVDLIINTMTVVNSLPSTQCHECMNAGFCVAELGQMIVALFGAQAKLLIALRNMITQRSTTDLDSLI